MWFMDEKKGARFFLKFPLTNLNALLKVIIFGLIPILNLISFGYILFAARNIYEKRYEMPDFNEYSIKSYFIVALLAIAIGIIYAVPIALFAGLLYLLVVMTLKLVAISIIAFILVIPISIIVALMSVAALLRFIETDEFKEAFNLKEVWGLINKANFGSIL